MKPNSFALFALAGTALLAFAGCASTNKTGGKGKQALVCPQCKMVAVTVNRPYSVDAVDYAGGYYTGTQTEYNHTCPNCQGAMTTLLKEGKLKHKCSVCKDSPFTCPVFHDQ